MADGKDRVRLLQQFDDDLHAPLGGSTANVDARLNAEFARIE